MINPVPKDRLERELLTRHFGLGQDSFDVFSRHLKIDNPFGKSLITPIEDGLPNGGNLIVEFDHCDVIDQLLEGGCKTDNPAAGEWLYQLCSLPIF